ncbi:MAG: hypothetical protein ACTHN7_00555, partial [Solirubrobacterales bacterium]
MAEEYVFRFIALRQPTTKMGPARKPPQRVPYSVRGEDPPLARKVFEMPVEQRTRRRLMALGDEFIAGDGYVRDLAGLPFEVFPIADWAEENAARKLGELDPASFFQSQYDRKPAKLVASKEFGEAAGRLAESLFAHAIADGNRARGNDELVHTIKLLYLAVAAASAPKLFEGEESLGELIGRLLVVIPELTTAPLQRSKPETKPQPPQGGRSKELEDRLEKLSRAHAELTSVLARPDAFYAEPAKITRDVQLPAGGERMAAIEAKLERIALKVDVAGEGEEPKPAARAPSGAAGTVSAKPRISLARPAASALSAATSSVLEELQVDPRSTDPFAMANLLEAQIAELSTELPTAVSARRMIAFGGGMLDAEAFTKTYGLDGPILEWGSLPTEQPCQFKAGIGDLLIVRQKLRAYELGDLAHVENVLRGEFREREHRRLDLREEVTTTETEQETEKERDLQSTERNEMQNEATKTVQSQFGLQAGLQVSGSYGPVVSFSASLNTSFSTSTSESQRKDTTFSREISEKT